MARRAKDKAEEEIKKTLNSPGGLMAFTTDRGTSILRKGHKPRLLTGAAETRFWVAIDAGEDPVL